jgi:hypothetical protein
MHKARLDPTYRALTAREIGATVITNNLLEFRRIAGKLPGLKITTP